MIEINLVPSNLRKTRKKSFLSSGFNIPIEAIIGLGGGFFILLVIGHIILLFINVKKIDTHKQLQAQWNEMLPMKNNVDSVMSEIRQLQGTKKALENITTGQDLLWSKKLNLISDSLPNGVWLRKIALTEKTFFIEGSAISKQSNEMINVHSFTTRLSSHSDFSEGFDDLDLGSIQRRNIQKTEVADFLITTNLK